MKLKIISDGTHRGTKVVNSETGEMVHGVVAVSWKFDLGHMSPTVTLELSGDAVLVELEGEARVAAA